MGRVKIHPRGTEGAPESENGHQFEAQVLTGSSSWTSLLLFISSPLSLTCLRARYGAGTDDLCG